MTTKKPALCGAAVTAAVTAFLCLLPVAQAQNPPDARPAPAKAPTPAPPKNEPDEDDDDDEFDAPGKDEARNRALWERVKGTPYETALVHIARVREEWRRQNRVAPAEVVLPTGWKIAPAGEQVSVGRLPYEAVSFAGKIVVLGNGYYTGQDKPEITVVDPATREARTVSLPDVKDALYPSAVVGADGDLYVSGGFARKVFRYNKDFELVNTYPVEGYAAGLAPVDATHLAVTTLLTEPEAPAAAPPGPANAAPPDPAAPIDAPGQYRKGKLLVLDTAAGKAGPSLPVGYFPTAVRYMGGKLYVAVQGEDRIAVYSTALDLLKSIPVGRSPQHVAVDGNRLYVANANSDSLSVVDTTRDAVVQTINLRADASPYGSAPSSCAVDGDRLYVTLANANAVAVLDRASGKRLGYIPAGWYPTRALVEGDRLFVVSAKGIVPRRPNPGRQYVLTLLRGSLGIVPKADIPARLSEWTKTAEAGPPSAARGALPPAKHVFYIVRENRTYDQVLGDLGRGDGDRALTLFGNDVTPNAHRIARDFVTLDNYYADGEISVLGHSFTTSGYASPLLEWVGNIGYSGRYPGYPYGSVPAVTSPSYLWDLLDSRKVDYRVYGENYYLYTRAYSLLTRFFGPDGELPRKFYAQSMRFSGVVDRGNRYYRLFAADYERLRTPESARALLEEPAFTAKLSAFLVGDGSLAAALAKDDALRRAFADYLHRYPSNYRSWDTAFSDLDRAKAWITDFRDQVGRGRVAPLHYLWLPNDHTGGRLTPEQMVAQNDAALGRILEEISRSPVWKDSLVLVTEDDAQAGPDHVDATRTICLAFGPYVRRGAVVSDRYDQLSLLRTLEMVLGLPPMHRGDALAVPMYGIFTETPDLRPYTPTAPSDRLTPEDRAKYDALAPGK